MILESIYGFHYRIYTSSIQFSLKDDLPSYSRSSRLTELLASSILQSNLTSKHMFELLYDVVDAYAYFKKEEMIKIISNHIDPSDVHAQFVIDSLSSWNGNYSQEYFEPTFFTLWEYYEMINHQQYKNLTEVDWLLKSFKETTRTLTQRYSSNPLDWKWKTIHKKSYPHFPFSRTIIKRFFFLQHSYGGSK